MTLLIKFSLLYTCIIYLTIFISIKFNLYDIPDGIRKTHKKKILNTAGLAFYLYLLFIIFNFDVGEEIKKIITVGLFVVILGFFDDQKKLSPLIKFTLLLFPVIYLILDGFKLNSLGEYQIIGLINLGKFSLFFTILSCGLLINSYNYVDGIDGLLITTTLVGLLYIMFIISDIDKSLFDFLLFVNLALIINLIFNFLPSKKIFKIFMGDSGSLFIGFFISFLMIYLYNYKNIHPSYLIWICWYPVYDFLYVTIKRIIHNGKFYIPDQNHFHHFLIKKFKANHIFVNFIITLLNIIVVSFNYLMIKNFGEFFSLVNFVLLFIFYLCMRLFFDRRMTLSGG